MYSRKSPSNWAPDSRNPLSLKLFCQLCLILEKIKAWVFYLIPQKQRMWFNFLSFQYSVK